MIELDGLDLPEAIGTAVRDLEADVEIEDFSGKGSNGYLFFGRHRILGTRVAIKFYYWEGGRHDEPRLLASLDHPNVTPVHDARFVDDEWALFLTPYYPSGDIDQVISRGRLSIHQALDHTIEILNGVSALHARDLLHRDLKPGNIFIDDRGSARIGDFGSVRQIARPADTVSGSGHSVLYRPFESFATNTYSRAGDLYQCGMVLYQLLGGNLPYTPEHWLDRKGRRCYDGASSPIDRSLCVDQSIQRLSQRQRLLDLDSLPRTVTEPLRRIVRKATRAAPTRRYESAAHFMNKLAETRSGVKDWYWKGSEAWAKVEGRTLRIRPLSDGNFRPESDKGNGFRRYGRISDGTFDAVLGAVEAAS